MPDSSAYLEATYTLPPVRRADGTGSGVNAALAEPVLRDSVAWFCRLRWGVVGLLLLVGLIGNIHPVVDLLGLVKVGLWPVVCGVVLALANAGFVVFAHRLGRQPPLQTVRRNLWAQILVDLLVLTAVVHFVGSTTTFIAFAYLFHVVLACTFFPARLSLGVTLLAFALFAVCVLAEHVGPLMPRTVFQADPWVTPGEAIFAVGSAGLIWFAIWHLASHLSAEVRRQNAALADANRRLLAAQAERSQHMLITTHQLKSPFAAIHANAQLLAGGYCGPLGEPALAVAKRILARCHRLVREIQEMLQLANLSSTSQSRHEERELDLARLVRQCVTEIEQAGQERNVRIELDCRPARVIGVEDHLRMMLNNILANAVAYSHPGGVVRVSCLPCEKGTKLVIADEGIGIAAHKLPRIFEEYYRTDEAVQHNPESSGLGLAIVRHVANAHNIQVCVHSRMGRGTTFELLFHDERVATRPKQGAPHGIPDDS